MSEKAPQNYANHARLVPLFHYVLFGILVVNLGWSVWGLIRMKSFSFDPIMNLMIALALLLIFWYARIFSLTVQDRVIRLEMRLRLREVLPEELRDRIGDLELGQLISLRFASDEELPDLVRQVLDEGLKSRSEIKQRIKDWQGDHLRC